MTLADVFKSMNLTTYDLTVDMLDVHAVRCEFFFRFSFVQILRIILSIAGVNSITVYNCHSIGSKHFPSIR